MPNKGKTSLAERCRIIGVVVCGINLIFLGGCLRRYELKVVPPATLLSPYEVIELKSKTFTIGFHQQRLIPKGAPPPGLNLGDTVQAMSNCWDDLWAWAGCRYYLEMVLSNGKAYHYWLVQTHEPEVTKSN
jgi:hypothetical protein